MKLLLPRWQVKSMETFFVLILKALWCHWMQGCGEMWTLFLDSRITFTPYTGAGGWNFFHHFSPKFPIGFTCRGMILTVKSVVCLHVVRWANEMSSRVTSGRVIFPLYSKCLKIRTCLKSKIFVSSDFRPPTLCVRKTNFVFGL